MLVQPHIRRRSRSSSAPTKSKKLPDPFPETLLEIEGPRGAIVTKPGYRMEVTVDGKMTASEFEIPMLHWAKKPWHMIEESVYKTCAHHPGGAQGRPRSGYFGARQSEDLCGLRGRLRSMRQAVQ